MVIRISSRFEPSFRQAKWILRWALAPVLFAHYNCANQFNRLRSSTGDLKFQRLWMSNSWVGTYERLENYLEYDFDPLAVVFDIGTRAARVLIGPKALPEDDWPRHMFFNASILTHLGAEMDRSENRLDLESPALNAVIDFIRSYRVRLIGHGLEADDFVGIGTAVFRWLENRSEVIDFIEAETGVRIRVLDGLQEAHCSLTCVSLTYRMRSADIPEYGDDDVLLLLDQGGGSMEVSYVFPRNMGQGEVFSFDQLGTIALRQRFFHMGPDGPTEPQNNKEQISAQHGRIGDFIREQLDGWDGYQALAGKRLHAYSLGSAVTRVFKRSNYDLHNRVLTLDKMDAEVKARCSWLAESREQVATVYRRLQREGAEWEGDVQALKDSVLLVYGLPVYQEVLSRFGLDHLRVCGYGLRYGVFAWLHKFHQPLMEVE